MAESKFLKWQDRNRDMLPDECPDAPPPGEFCLRCSPNPTAVVPNWRKRDQREPFLNEKLCEYWIAYVSREMNTGYEPGMSEVAAAEKLEEIFLKYREDAIETLLDFYGKDVSPESIETVAAVIQHKEYELDPRPGARLKLLYTVDFDTIDNLPDWEEEVDDEIPDPEDRIFNYNAHDFVVDAIKVRKGLNLYGRYYRVYRALEGGVLKFVDDGRIFNLEDYGDSAIFWSDGHVEDVLNGLDGWLNNRGYNIANTGGFWGFLEEKVIKLSFTLTHDYELKVLKIWTEQCGEKPIVFKGSRIKSLKNKSAWRDKTAVAYLMQVGEFSAALQARVELPWIDNIKQFTYPEVYATSGTDTELSDERTTMNCIADALAGEMKELGQDILDEVFGIGDAIAYAFHKNLCRYNPLEVNADNIEIGKAFGVDPIEDHSKILAAAHIQAFKELESQDQVFGNFCARLLGMRTMGSPLQILDSLWANGFERLEFCGLLDLMLEAIKCLFGGLTLEEALAALMRAALGAMSITDFGKLFIGLPPDKQAELDELVKKKLESGDIFAEGTQMQYASDSMEHKQSTGDAPIWGKTKWVKPWENQKILDEEAKFMRENGESGVVATKAPTYGTSESSGDPRRSLAQKLDAYGTHKDELNPNIIMEAYVLALLEVYSENLLGLLDHLNRFPGAQIVAAIISTFDCPRPPLFNPGILDFIKSLGLPFCRTKNQIVMLRFENPFMYIPKLKDIVRVILEIMKRLLLQLLLKIIIMIIVKICEIIGDAICKALEIAGTVAASLPALVTGRANLADIIRDAICGPDADDQLVNNTVTQLMADLGPGGAALADPARALTFAEDLSAASTRAELMSAMLGDPSETFLEVADQIVDFEYPDYRDGLPNKKAIGRFFVNIGNLVPLEAKKEMRQMLDMFPEDDDMPANPSLCATPGQLEEFGKLRCDLLAGRASPEQCEAMFENYRGSLLDDLSDVATVMNKGFGNAVAEALPPVFSDPGCDNGMLPFQPEDSIFAATQTVKGDADKLKLAFTEDMLGNGGLFTGQDAWGMLNMVLSDTKAFPYTTHKRYAGSDRNYMDFYLDGPGADAFEEDGWFFTSPGPLATQEGAYPKYVASWLRQQFELGGKTMVGSRTGNSNLAQDLHHSFEFNATNDVQYKKSWSKSFDDMGWVGFLGFTNVDLLSIPDLGYNVKTRVQFSRDRVKFTRMPRKKTADFKMLFKDNCAGYRFGRNGGQSQFSRGFEIKAYYSDIISKTVDGQTYYMNRDDDNVRIKITELFNPDAILNVMPEEDASGNDTDSINAPILKNRLFEFIAVDPTFEDVDMSRFPSFSENSQRKLTIPPQVNLLSDLIGGAIEPAELLAQYNDIQDKIYRMMFSEVAAQEPEANEAPWLYGVKFDDLIRQDMDLLVKKDAVDNFEEYGETEPGYYFYDDAVIYEYDEDGNRDGERPLLNEDGIMGVSRMQAQMENAGTPEDNRIFYLDPGKYGGSYVNPPIYFKPNIAEGWYGMIEVLFPDKGACKPYRNEVVNFEDIHDKIDSMYPRIPEDHRLKSSEHCAVELPYNRILERAGRTGIMATIFSTIRIYCSVHFMKSLHTFSIFAPKFPENYSNVYCAYVADNIERSLSSPSGNPFAEKDFWYAFLEQCVQLYAYMVDDGQIPSEEVPRQVRDALEKLNDLQENYNYPWSDDLDRAKDRDDAGEFQTLKSYRNDKNLEAVRRTEEHAKLVFLELVKMEMNNAGQRFMENLPLIGIKPKYNDMEYFFMSERGFAFDSTLDMDKKIKFVGKGIPDESTTSGAVINGEVLDDRGFPGPFYTTGGEFTVTDGTTYVGYYHIHIDEEDGSPLYMVGEEHSSDDHEMLRPYATKLQLDGIGGVPDFTGESSPSGAGITAGKPFLIEKYISIDGSKYSVVEATDIIKGAGSGNISDHWPGDMKLVKNDLGNVIGIEGNLGVKFGLQFSYVTAGGKYPISSVEINALDIPVSAFYPLMQDNSLELYCLVKKLKEDENFKLITGYVFSLRKATAITAIYNDMGFLHSIGEITVADGESISSFWLPGTDTASKWPTAGGTKPGAHALMGESEVSLRGGGDVIIKVPELVDVSYNEGWMGKWDRTPFLGNPFVLKWDEWDRIVLRNSASMAKKVFNAHYYSRDFGSLKEAGGSGVANWLETVKARFKIAPPTFFPSWARGSLRSNPFNADDIMCEKPD